MEGGDGGGGERMEEGTEEGGRGWRRGGEDGGGTEKGERMEGGTEKGERMEEGGRRMDEGRAGEEGSKL